MSQKTSNRQNTQKYKGRTRKNGGTHKVGTIKLVKWSRWFFEDYAARPLPMSMEEGMEYGKKAIVMKMKEEGMKMKEIGELFHKNLQRKKLQIQKYNVIFKHLHSWEEYLKDIVGIEEKHFVVDWVCSVAVCLKLKVIKIDKENGCIQYIGTPSGMPKCPNA